MDLFEQVLKNLAPDEQKFGEFIKDKSVAIVGPSPWLNGRKMGPEIDKHDIIVRINQGIYLPYRNKDDYGSRTDVAYISQRARDRYGHDLPKEYQDCKYLAVLTQKKYDDFPPMQMTCCICKEIIKHGEEFGLPEYLKDTSGGVNISLQELGHPQCIYPNVNYDTVGVPVVKRDLAIYQKCFQTSLLSGVLAVFDALIFKAKDIYVYGFDFYHAIKDTIKTEGEATKVTDMYCEGYVVFKNTLTHSHKDTEGKQLYLFKTLVDQFPQIHVDENLAAIIAQEFQPLPRFSRYDDVFVDLVKGKKVVIIGNGPWLKGKAMGDELGDYDIIVRLNNGIHLATQKPNDYGRKISFVYVNELMRITFTTEPPKIYDNCKLLIVETRVATDSSRTCCKCKKTIKPGFEFGVDKDYVNAEEKAYHWNCIAYMNYGVCKNILAIDSEPLRKELDGEDPLIGMLALQHILSAQPKSVHVVNWDFYKALKRPQTPNNIVRPIDLYAEGYRLFESSLSTEKKDMNGKQLKLFNKWYKKKYKGIITVDKNLKKICKDL